MTRFARSKGSKASNERIPEPATSWSEMKEQLLSKNREISEQSIREEALQKRESNYKTFLREREEDELKNVSWAEFGDIDNKNVKNKRKSENLDTSSSPVKIKRSEPPVNDDSDEAPEECGVKEKPKEVIINKKLKKPKLKIVSAKEEKFNNNVAVKTPINSELKSEQNTPTIEIEPLSPRSARKIQKKNERFQKQLKKKLEKRKEKRANKEKQDPNSELTDKSESINANSTDDLSKIEKKKQRRMRQAEKRKQFKELKQSTSQSLNENDSKSHEENKGKLSEDVLAKIEKRKQKRIRQAEKRKQFRELKKQNETNVNSADNDSKIIERPIPSENGIKKKFDTKIKKNAASLQSKKDKFKGNKEPRKKPMAETMFINGKSVDIDYIEGFPVKKEDAERIKKLKKDMIAKGLPRSEINVALKLERRRAEKALAREKKNVCFNCRKSGHNLSECPELGKGEIAESMGTGICFKCGSTEHTHFECKVVKGDAYKFAKCFICNEQGHISRQCPDNQRGLYPKGGACKVCGDVTHLKKDCPKYQVQQQQLQNNVDIGTIGNSNPDDLGGENIKITKKFAKPNKIVKF